MRIRLLGLIVIMVFALCASAQVSEQQVKEAIARYERPEMKAILLRSFYAGSEIRYREDGDSSAPSGIWTVDGWVRTRNVKVDADRMKFRMQRLVVSFTEKKMKLVDSPETEAILVLPVPQDEAALKVLLDRVFYRSDEDYLGTLPSFWKAYFERLASPPPQEPRDPRRDPPEVKNTNGFQIYTPGKGVDPPRARTTPDPVVNEVAKRIVGSKGVVVLWCIIGPDGRAHEIKIARAVGYGLDEDAIRAVQGWGFAPAKFKGNPVAVQINIEVHMP